jgi:hypothetical protein
MIDAANEGLCQVDVVDRGQAVLAQGDRQAHLGVGDPALVDPARPVRYASTETTHVSVLFPSSLASLRPQDFARATAPRVPGDHGTGAPWPG